MKNGASQPQAASMSVVGPKTPAVQKLQLMDFPAHTFPHIMRGIMGSRSQAEPQRSFFSLQNWAKKKTIPFRGQVKLISTDLLMKQKNTLKID